MDPDQVSTPAMSAAAADSAPAPGDPGEVTLGDSTVAVVGSDVNVLSDMQENVVLESGETVVLESGEGVMMVVGPLGQVVPVLTAMRLPQLQHLQRKVPQTMRTRIKTQRHLRISSSMRLIWQTLVHLAGR